jgi:hypothetical protein
VTYALRTLPESKSIPDEAPHTAERFVSSRRVQSEPCCGSTYVAEEFAARVGYERSVGEDKPLLVSVSWVGVPQISVIFEGEVVFGL